MKEFVNGLLRIIIAATTAFFSVVGAAEILNKYLVNFHEDIRIALAIIYFLFVLMVAGFGWDALRESWHKQMKGKKK